MPDVSTAIEVPTRAAMHDLGRRIAAMVRAGDLVVLTGDLGSGKTTLTQGIGDGLGVRGPITSPTFVIARVHPSLVNGPPLVHVDAYRLASLDEVDDLDLDASLDEAVTIVEWGQGLVDGLSADRLEVTLVRRSTVLGTTGSPRPSGPGGTESADDEDRDEDREEVRTVQLSSTGERWAGVDLASAIGSGSTLGPEDA